jgi:hypothetical protein
MIPMHPILQYTKRFFLLLLFSGLLNKGLSAQNRLIMHVQHLTRVKRVEFGTGDEIKFRLKDDPAKYSGKIGSIGDSLINISDLVIPIKSIAVIYVNNANYLSSMFSKFMIRGGLGFIALDAINNLANGTNPIVNPLAVYIGLPVALVGEMIRLLSYKKYRIGSKCTLWVVG